MSELSNLSVGTTQRRIAELADEWRAIARACPRWMLEDRQGEVVLIDSWFGDPLVTLHGPQRAALGRYFRALHCDAGSALAEVLWLIGQGGGDQRVRRQALELFRAMGLAEPAPPAK